MLIFQGISPRLAARKGRSVTIGNFDGVHLGHQALLSETIGIAREQGLVSAVVTFEPHPKAYFMPEKAPRKIQGLRGKAAALAALGIDELWILRFNRQLAVMTAQEFMQNFLHGSMNAKALVLGDDFRFGAKRQGDAAMLESASAALGWHVHQVGTVLLKGERASSSLLRNALSDGDIARAQAIMGRPYCLSGHVVHGKKMGRRIGFPTLNIPVHKELLISGVFVVSVEGLGDPGKHMIAGVASLGRRPTVEQGGRLLLEVHLFDWQGDAYGKIVNVTFHEKLRDEIHYDTIDRMTRQIQLDAQAARLYFSHHVH